MVEKKNKIKAVSCGHASCRHFIGEKPCQYKKKCEPKKCGDRKLFGKRILIIKLAAVGDVLRTTPVLSALRKKYPVCHITWLTSPDSMEALSGNPYIDRIYTTDQKYVFRLLAESFDILLSLDKDLMACGIASIIRAKDKKGFGLSEEGNLIALNGASRYAYELGFNDELKFVKNRKTYQELIFDMCELSDKYGEYILKSDKVDVSYAKDAFNRWNIKNGDLVIGLNTGAGRVFRTKKWDEGSFASLAEYVSKRLGAKVLLLGGPEEIEVNKRIASKARSPVINTGNDHTIKQFAEIVGRCNVVVTADTLAMHLAIARKVLIVALFGSTSPHEVDLYGRGIKIFNGNGCGPCYKNSCDDMQCMNSIAPEDVISACSKLLENGR